ncbi:tetratricopeptide repeat protein [Hellea balneolensis]|uniref:tetratricopeptide repeat protein n=1 Tax=Hellea balneolensis TaxID=287478 RepID=UPI00047D31AB|nr:tetratricopeptide repeat protein [Hellea balneolensis]
MIFAISDAFANESSLKFSKQLKEIINLLQNDSRDEALNQLQLQESDLVSSVRESKDSEAYMLLGNVYFFAEMDSKAMEAFKSALQFDASLSDAHFFIGRIHGYANNLEDAEKSFQDAISLNNSEEKYFIELGLNFEKRGDKTSASSAYKTALALNGKNHFVNSNLATIYATEGDTDNAVKHYLAAIEQEPNDLTNHYNLGQLYQNAKQHELALKQFEKVVKLDPNEWQAIQKLVQENEALNNFSARDSAIESIYELWRENENKELREQNFFIREQSELENGKLFVLEYFELSGERARKFVFKLQDEQTGDILFDVSLGSYDSTTAVSRALGEIGADERIYHLDGYSPNGSHYTYAFFDAMPTYEVVKEMALKKLANENKSISSTIPSKE